MATLGLSRARRTPGGVQAPKAAGQTGSGSWGRGDSTCKGPEASERTGQGRGKERRARQEGAGGCQLSPSSRRGEERSFPPGCQDPEGSTALAIGAESR